MSLVSTTCYSSTRTIYTYSDYEQITVKVYEPSSIQELIELVQYFNRETIQFSVMGAALSFDNQFFNDAAIVSTQRLKHFSFNPKEGVVTAAPGVTWDTVIEEVEPEGFIPYIVPTAGNITVGGSIAADTYSRYSPSFGRESRWIKSMKVLTTEGELFDCSRTQNADLFYACMGGFGLVGIICEMKFKVLHVGKDLAMTTICRYSDGLKAIDCIHPDVLFEGHSKEDYPGSGCIIYPHKDDYGLLMVKHGWECTTKRNKSFAHSRKGATRVFIGVLMRIFPKLASFTWNLLRRTTEKAPNKELKLIDDAIEALLFMEGDWWSKKIARRLGINTKLIQQGFIIPFVEGNLAENTDRFRTFIEYCLMRLKDYKIKPAMIDIGFMPKGDRNAFNLNPSEDAFMVSIALEGVGIPSHDLVSRLFQEFSELCYNKYQGRLHLIKNIHCSSELLCKMFEEELEVLLKLKQKYDPKGLLRTNFFEEKFGVACAVVEGNSH